MIYINGDSYSEKLSYKTYGDYLQDRLHQSVINRAKSGSSNRRIFRTTVRDILELINSGQTDITAIIGLSFIERTEIWKCNKLIEENYGNFTPLRPTDELYKKWLPFQSYQGELLNLFFDLVSLTSFLKLHNINYVIFPSGPIHYVEYFDVSKNYSKFFYDVIKNDPSILPLFDFCMAKHISNAGFVPVDFDKYGSFGHAGSEGHAWFAEWLIDNYLNNLLNKVN